MLHFLTLLTIAVWGTDIEEFHRLADYASTHVIPILEEESWTKTAWADNQKDYRDLVDTVLWIRHIKHPLTADLVEGVVALDGVLALYSRLLDPGLNAHGIGLIKDKKARAQFPSVVEEVRRLKSAVEGN